MPDQNNQPPRPSDAVLMRVQKEEIDRINDNRIYLMGIIEEIKAEAEREIHRLLGVVSQLRGLVPVERETEAMEIITGVTQESSLPT